MKKIIAKNKNLRNYEKPIQYIEAGIVLKGSEIKSIRMNGADISNAYVTFGAKSNEVYVIGMLISDYKFATIESHNPSAKRKLLLHKKEILKLKQNQKTKNYIYLVASIYLNKDNFLKVSIAITKSIKKQDKREIEKAKMHKKELKAYIK